MEKELKIILANAPIKNGNRGCVALSITTLYLIDKVLTRMGKNYTIYLPDSQFGDNTCHKYHLPEKDITFHDLSYCKGYTPKQNLKIKIKNLIKHKTFRTKDFKNADFILDIGQGDSFSDIYGEPRFQSIDLIHKIAQEYKKPYCLLPQTIGPFKDDEIRRIAIKSITNASLCMARDKQSYDYVINNAPGQKNIKEYIDVAFFLPYEKIEQPSQFTHVGLNISALLWHGGYTRNNQFGLTCDYPKVACSIIDYFLSLKDVKVHLIPHVVGSERGIENDYAVSYDLWVKYKNPNLILAPLALGPIEIKSYIAGMDFFAGARMHATIGAFSAGVPVVPMAYSRKFNGLFIDTLSYPYMVDMKAMTNEEILANIQNGFTNRQTLKRCIKEQMDTTVKERGELLLNDLQDFFSKA
jgi:polysaccharide pyruvyl transferase WcaK-like protein